MLCDIRLSCLWLLKGGGNDGILRVITFFCNLRSFKLSGDKNHKHWFVKFWSQNVILIRVKDRPGRMNIDERSKQTPWTQIGKEMSFAGRIREEQKTFMSWKLRRILWKHFNAKSLRVVEENRWKKFRANPTLIIHISTTVFLTKSLIFMDELVEVFSPLCLLKKRKENQITFGFRLTVNTAMKTWRKSFPCAQNFLKFSILTFLREKISTEMKHYKLLSSSFSIIAAPDLNGS